MTGVCLSVEKGKARFATASQGTVNVPVENVLLETGQSGQGSRDAAAWWERAESGGAELDLAEMWDLVREEGEIWDAGTLEELYFDGETAPEQRALFLVGLDQSLYFEGEGAGFRPCTKAEVAEKQMLLERERARAEERALFREWFFSRDSVEGTSGYLADWVERLKDYALYGETSAHFRWVERMSEGQADRRRAFVRLVAAGVWGADENLDLIRENVPLEFPSVAIKAAGALRLEPLLEDPRRRDLTGLDVFTIDDAQTVDMDDGLSIAFEPDGTCRVGVHITDVGGLVATGSALDREAAGRVSSLYFPDRKIPMFPSRISEDLGSLRSGVPRLAVSLLATVDGGGTVREVEIVPSVVQCRQKLDYDEVDAILEDASHRLFGPLSGLHRVAEAHLIERMHQGAIALERSERQIHVTAEGEILFSLRPQNSRSNLLVSELMVMANAEVARFCRDRDIPIVYRTQPAPDLEGVEETENEALYRYRALRRMRPASMSLEPGAHGGLGVEPYCQASSPLRRYADLAVQRQVTAFLLGEPMPYDGEGIREVLYQAEERTREIGRLERRRERYWLFRYLEQFPGRDFEAVVLEARERELLVEVGALGLHVEVRPTRPAEPGETVTVRLNRSDPWGEAVFFSQVA